LVDRFIPRRIPKLKADGLCENENSSLQFDALRFFSAFNLQRRQSVEKTVPKDEATAVLRLQDFFYRYGVTDGA
jgi:hypothetical protein